MVRIKVLVLMVLTFLSSRGFGPFSGRVLGLCLISFIIFLLIPIVFPPSLLPLFQRLIHLHLGYFLPISLLGSIYKFLAKILVARLFGVMDKLIPPSQSAFLKGRFLVNGVVFVNELVDLAKNNKKIVLFLKFILRKFMILLADLFLTICFLDSSLIIC